MRGYPEHLHEVINEDLQESIYDETLEGETIRDNQYSLEIMKQELNSKYICPEIKYAFKNSIQALEKQIPKKPTENFYDEQDGEDWYDEGYTYSCPSCEDDREIGRYSKELELWIFEIHEYCPYCGQKIDNISCT